MSVSANRVHVLGSGRLVERLVDQLPALLPGTTVGRSSLGEPAPRGGVAIPVVRLDRVDALGPWLGRLEHSLAIGFHRGLVYVGPRRRVGRRGCLACLVGRVAGSSHGPSVDGEGRVRPVTPVGCDPLELYALRVVPALLAEELRLLWAGEEPRTSRGAIVLDQQTGEVAFEALVPDDRCDLCGEPATRRVPRPALEDGDPCRGDELRTADAPALVQAIEDTYLNRHIGLVKDIQIDLQSPYGTCYLELPLKGKRSEPCIGRSTTYAKARSIAILEALERYCGWRGGDSREVITAPFEEVADRALDPTSLGLHPDECYAQPGYPFARPTAQLPIDWVWGHSFRRQAPVLVPARYAFYGYRGERPFVYEVSNGCALGATLEEATIHGLFEVVERDSFLLTWYRKLALPEVSTADIPDRGVRDLLRRAELTTGTRIRLFLSTREHGIPSLFAVATSDAEGTPRTLAAGAAHVSLLCAARSVIYELAGLVLRMQTILLERHADAEAMLDDPSQVRKMEDHSLVNCLPQARERFAFLLEQSSAPRSFGEAQAACELRLPPQTTIPEALRLLVDRVLGAGLDVVVVDQTMSELDPAGLHCAKVIVPGTLSMTFGHAFRRTAGLARLEASLPEARAGAHVAELQPHPFP